jgi:pimeloyl-ACP methyl ester carboxylesterase
MITHEWIKTNGIELHCAIKGQGPLVILLHGFLECWYSWRHQIKSFSNQFRVVAPDMRGYNESAKPSGIHSYELSNLIQDIAGLVHALGEEDAIIVGHDIGGYVSWGLAMEQPKIVKRLVVLNCPHPAIVRIHQKQWNLRQYLRSWYTLFFQLPWIPEVLLGANNAKAIPRIIRNSAIQKEKFTKEDFDYFCRAATQPNALHSSINYYRAIGRSLLKPQWLNKNGLNDWPKIQAPTLLLWGQKDSFLGNELTEGMEELFTNSFKLQLIPDCGHWVQQEKADLVNQYLKEFLQG